MLSEKSTTIDEFRLMPVAALAGVVARRGIGGGALANSAAAEALTSVLIWINRQYKVSGAGIVISGLDATGSP